MKNKVSLAVALLMAFALTSSGQEDKKPPMDPAMMEAMRKAGTPGAEHKGLGDFAGSWNAKVSMWMAPGTDPMVMEGTAETRWIMGGRYLEQRFNANYMGMPFEGLGYTGYDNVKKQYWSTWMDNMSTGFMLQTGTADKYTGMMADPMTGKDVLVESRLKVSGPDSHAFEMWTPAPDGKMFRSMEIAYTRKN